MPDRRCRTDFGLRSRRAARSCRSPPIRSASDRASDAARWRRRRCSARVVLARPPLPRTLRGTASGNLPCRRALDEEPDQPRHPAVHRRRIGADDHRPAGSPRCEGLAPENTLPGFALAMKLGVTTLELDVVATRDGVLVISHDPRSIRHHPRPQRQLPALHRPNIIDLTVDELSQFDVGRIDRGASTRGHSRVNAPSMARGYRGSPNCSRWCGRPATRKSGSPSRRS